MRVAAFVNVSLRSHLGHGLDERSIPSHLFSGSMAEACMPACPFIFKESLERSRAWDLLVHLRPNRNAEGQNTACVIMQSCMIFLILFSCWRCSSAQRDVHGVSMHVCWENALYQVICSCVQGTRPVDLTADSCHSGAYQNGTRSSSGPQETPNQRNSKMVCWQIWGFQISRCCHELWQN